MYLLPEFFLVVTIGRIVIAVIVGGTAAASVGIASGIGALYLFIADSIYREMIAEQVYYTIGFIYLESFISTGIVYLVYLPLRLRAG